MLATIHLLHVLEIMYRRYKIELELLDDVYRVINTCVYQQNNTTEHGYYNGTKRYCVVGLSTEVEDE